MEATTWIPIVLSCVMAIIAIITLANNNKKDTQKEAEERAAMRSDMKYIRTSVDEIRLDNKSIQKDVADLKIKVVEIEQGMKSAHKRIDDMQKG
jgi:peptidoglycan hydrolase CwlO-like protein